MSDYAVSVKNVSKKFNLFHEKRDSIYESAAGFFQKKRHSEILQTLDDVSFNVKRGKYLELSDETETVKQHF